MKEFLHSIIVTSVTLGALIFFANTLAHAGFRSPEEDLTVSAPNSESSTHESDTKIFIPSIDVVADVQHVGLSKSGDMAVPTNFSDVGWYRHGTKPGEKGSAVIDGHVDNGLGRKAVFHDLALLSPGDNIYVENESNSKLRFVVEEVKMYDADDIPADVVFNRSDRPRLNLITCGGTWDKEARKYDERVVVYAVLA